MATTSVTGIGASQDQFIQLLIAQLRNQSPLDPIKSQDFIAQLASLQTVQGLTSLNASFGQMLKLQQLTQGTDLLGKTVSYVPTGGGDARTGTVTGVTVDNGNFVLQIGADAVGLDQIQKVTG